MEVRIEYNQSYYIANLQCPIDISLPIRVKGAIAWGAPRLQIKPVVDGSWVGDVDKGAPVNFNNIFF